MVNLGLKENEVTEFLREKGAYMVDDELFFHCIKMGKNYERPLGRLDLNDLDLS